MSGDEPIAATWNRPRERVLIPGVGYGMYERDEEGIIKRSYRKCILL